VAKAVFKHQEDDGDLSIFASGDVVLLACEHGHYWVINAKEHSNETVKGALAESLPEHQADMLLRAM
jgi:hypothetical protein